MVGSDMALRLVVVALSVASLVVTVAPVFFMYALALAERLSTYLKCMSCISLDTCFDIFILGTVLVCFQTAPCHCKRF